MSGIVIVGASVAGVSVARSLRTAGFTGPIRLLDREAELPYDKPPLSKGGVDDPQRLVTEAQARDEGLELVRGFEATRLDAEGRAIVGPSGERIPFDTAVLATGLAARPGPWAGRRVHTLRTLDDARRLHADLAGARRILIVGAGFIGSELASVARARGTAVTMVDAATNPAAPLVGTACGDRLMDLHRQHGVDLRLGCTVDRWQERVDGCAAQLNDGTVIDADLMVVAIGAVPHTAWLADSGASDLSDGIGCDRYGRVTGLRRVFAAGDVARWDHGDGVPARRFEHWTEAVSQGEVVAHNIVAPHDHRTHQTVPSVWSDQYGRTIQIVGSPDVDGDPASVVVDEDRSLTLWQNPDGSVRAAVTVGWPRAAVLVRQGIARGTPCAAVLERLRPVGAAR